MSEIALEPGTVEPGVAAGSLDLPVVALRDLVPWAIFAGALLLVLLYLIGAEEGATSIVSGRYVHEFLHDGRHLLAFPCH